MHGRGNICRTGRRMRFTFSPVAKIFPKVIHEFVPGCEITTRTRRDVRAIFSKMRHAWNRAKSILHRVRESYIWLRHRKCKVWEIQITSALSMSFLRNNRRRVSLLITNNEQKWNLSAPNWIFFQFLRYNCWSREWIIARKFHSIFLIFHSLCVSSFMNHFHYEFQSECFRFRKYLLIPLVLL